MNGSNATYPAIRIILYTRIYNQGTVTRATPPLCLLARETGTRLPPRRSPVPVSPGPVSAGTLIRRAGEKLTASPTLPGLPDDQGNALAEDLPHRVAEDGAVAIALLGRRGREA